MMSSTEGLCCCEYENMDGERSHIFACCCDCEAADQVADKFLKCEKIPDLLMKRMFDTVNDRCRIPGIFGAIPVQLDIVVPCFFVIFCIYISTRGPGMTFIMLTSMPILMFSFYHIWKKNTHRTRTKFFFSWGLTSVLVMFFVFHIYIVSFRKVLLWEHLLLFTAFVSMMYFFIKTKNSTNILRRGLKDAPKNRNTSHTSVPIKSSVPDSIQITVTQEVSGKDVTWVDSRPIVNGKLKIWCEVCHYKRPPRSGHCDICNACISVRDHHCVWIDCCIGSHNHLSFVITMALFLFCGFYGFHLTMTTVCTPSMYLGWFLFPNDCRFLYIDFQTSVSFVSACYTLLSSLLMLCNFLFQLVLISQNTTSQEFHQATKNGKRSRFLLVKHNVHNRGFLRNWMAFLFTRREEGNNLP